MFGQPENDSSFELPWKHDAPDDSDKEKEIEADAGGQDEQQTPLGPHAPGDQLAQQTTDTDPEQQSTLQPSIQQQTSHVLRPQKTPEGIALIDWYTTDDAANPHNWSWKKKATSAAIINLYTFGVYSCSAIITPAHNEIMERFNVSYAVASLTLSMYVIGYGIGPLVSRLSHQ